MSSTAVTESNHDASDDLARAKEYDTKPWQQKLSAQIAEAILARGEWIHPRLMVDSPSKNDDDGNEKKEDLKLLDFACGTGNVSFTLAPYVTTIRGIDISPSMVKTYNRAATGTRAHAVQGDLFAPDGTPEQFLTHEFSNFDIAIIGLGFHHFENPKLALERLYERLKPITGMLVVIDFLPFTAPPATTHHDAESPAGTAIKHPGFTPETLRDMFTAAGFLDFDIGALKQPAVLEGKDGEVRERTVFFAKGRKAGSVWQRFGGWVAGIQDVIGGQMDVHKGPTRREGWNPTDLKEARGSGTGGQGWDMLGGSGSSYVGRGGGNQVKEEKKVWNGFS